MAHPHWWCPPIPAAGSYPLGDTALGIPDAAAPGCARARQIQGSAASAWSVRLARAVPLSPWVTAPSARCCWAGLWFPWAWLSLLETSSVVRPEHPVVTLVQPRIHRLLVVPDAGLHQPLHDHVWNAGHPREAGLAGAGEVAGCALACLEDRLGVSGIIDERQHGFRVSGDLGVARSDRVIAFIQRGHGCIYLSLIH